MKEILLCATGKVELPFSKETKTNLHQFISSDKILPTSTQPQKTK